MESIIFNYKVWMCLKYREKGAKTGNIFFLQLLVNIVLYIGNVRNFRDMSSLVFACIKEAVSETPGNVISGELKH